MADVKQVASGATLESIGTVKTVVGTVKAVDQSGAERILQAGDKVFANETIVTADGGLVLIEFADGSHLDLASASQIILDSDVFNPANAAPKGEELTAEQIQEMIARGEDPTAVTEATAAGAGAGDEGGSSFIVVDYNNTQGDVTSGFDTQGIPGPESTTFTELPPVEDDVVVVTEPVPTTMVTEIAVDEDDIFHYFSENELNWGEEFFADVGDFSIYNRPGIGAIDGNTSDTDEGDGDALGDPAGPLESDWPVINPSAAIVSGTLNAAFGADGAGNIVFTIPTQVVTSTGETVQYWISDDGHTLIGYITAAYGEGIESRIAQEGSETFNQIIFSAEITDVATGAYTFTLYGSVDHAVGEGENDLALNLSYTITDSDGDAAAGLLVVNVDDDSPVIGYPGSGSDEVQSANVYVPTIVVDEDDLKSGNGDSVEGDDSTYWWQSYTTLPVMFGADGPAAENAVQLSSTGIVDQYGQPLASGGQALQYVWDAETGTLTGYIGTLAQESYQEILTVTVTGIWTSGAEVYLALSGPLDHPNGEDQTLPEDNLVFNISYTATDFDGDSVTGTFAVNVDDDSPVAEDTEGSVDEGAIADGTLAFMAGADGATITHINGEELAFDEDGWSQEFEGEHGVLQVKADGTYRFTAQADDAVVSSGSDSFSFTVTDGDNDTSIADFDVAINDVPTLTLVSIAGPANVMEGASTTEYTLSVNHVPAADVTITVAYSGVALDGTDYTGEYSFTIPAGETEVTFDLATIDDNIAEVSEGFTVTISSVSGGNFEQLEINPAADHVDTTITDEDQPDTTPQTALVSIEGPATVVEGSVTTDYTLSVNQTSTAPVNVTVAYSGVALDGTDYVGEYTFTIPAGSPSVTFDLATIDDNLAEVSEAFTVTITEVTGGGFELVAADPLNNSVTTTITDEGQPDDTPQTALVSIEGPATVVEGSVTTDYTLSVNQTSTAPVNVTVAYSGVALDGTDYVGEYTFTIPAGSPSVTFDLATIDDNLAEVSEAFTVTITEVTGGGFELVAADPLNNSVTTTITDEGQPDTTPQTALVSIEGPATVVEGATTSNYTVTVNQVPTAPLVVSFTYTGVAADGSDYTGVASVTIPQNSNSTTFNIATLDDNIADNGESFTITITGVSGGGFELAAADPLHNSVTTTITDQAPTTAPDSYVTNEDTALTVSTANTGVLGNDSGEGGLTIQSYTQPEHGTLTVNANGTFTYTPDHDYSGTDSFTYTPVDGNGVAAAPVTVNLLVNPVTDTPTVQLSLTPVVSSELYAADLFNVLSNPDGQAGNPLGFTVTAYKDGQVADISIRYKDANGVELSPTGFGVAGAAGNGDAVEIGKGEKLVVDLDTPASSVTFQLAWLNNSNETAVYTVRYTDGTSAVFNINGGSDGIEAPVTVTAPNGKTIDAIEFSTPTTGGRVDTSDYMLHSVSYVSATQTYSVDIVATPTDIDFSESIVSLIVTTPAGVTLSDAQFVSTLNGVTTWSLIVNGSTSGPTVTINDTTGAVTVSGLTLTVPADYSGDLTVTATAVAQDGTAATASAFDSETVSTEVLPSTAYIVVNTSNTGGGGTSGEQQFEVIITNGNTTLAKTATLQDEQGQQDIPLTFDQNVQFLQGQTYTVVMDHVSGSAHVNVTDFSITDTNGNVITLNGNGGNNNTTLIGTPTGAEDETTNYDGVIYNITGATNPANIQVSNPIGYDVNTENFNGNASSKVLVLDSLLGSKEDFSLDFSDLPLNGAGQTDLFGVINKINISGNGGTQEDNTVVLTAQDVLDLGSGGNHTVFITGDAQDVVKVSGMNANGTVDVGGVTYNSYTVSISGTVATLNIEQDVTVQTV